MRCKHRDRYGYSLAQFFNREGIELKGRLWESHLVAWMKCERCGDYMKLGPSNDDDPRVAVEMRAAEIAAVLDDADALCDWTLSNETFVSFTTFEERRGWSIAESNMQTHSDAWQSGYLARCIAEHDGGDR